MKEKKAGARGRATTSPRQQGTWSEAAVRVLRERYLLRGQDGAIAETPD